LLHKNNISPHIHLHKKDPLNQFIWVEISDINAKKMYIEIFYFAPINSTFYTKNNLDKNCPYKSLEQDIYSLRNEGSILHLGDFNARTATNQPLTLTLNFAMHRSAIEENYNNQRQLLFDKSKVDVYLKDLKSELHLLNYKDNIEDLYHNFTTTLSTSINKFSFEVSCKNNNRMTNPWYDKECKISKKSIRDYSNDSLKIDNIITYKSLIKRKKMYYINKRQEKLSQLSKLHPKKLWRQILTRNTKENNIIPLREWNSYLKILYEFHNAIDTIRIVSTEDEVYSLDDIDFRVKQLANGKAKDIEGYQDAIFKIGGPILIPHIQKVFNLEVKKGFPKSWMQSLIVPIFLNGDKKVSSNYKNIMISPFLAMFYGIILEKNIILWLESHSKISKVQVGFRRYRSIVDHIFTSRIISEEFHNTKTNLFCCFVDFRKAFDTIPRKNLSNRLEEITFPFKLRVVVVRLYGNAISKFKNHEGWLKEINYNIGVKKGCPLTPTLFAYTLTI
jgi:hypothetical protein